MIDWIGDVIVGVIEVAGMSGEGFHPRPRRLSDVQRRRRARMWWTMLVLAVAAVVMAALYPAWPAAVYLFGGGVAVAVISLAMALEHRRQARRNPEHR